MSDRIKLLMQKRTSLKSQITHLNNLIEKGNLDDTILKLRTSRLTDLYHSFEESNDELVVLDPNESHQTEFTNIQDRFYSLVGKVENHLIPPSTSSADNNETRSDNQSDRPTPIAIIGGRRIKLPVAPLPTFDGKYEGWLSFKNAFRNLIDSQSDLTDIDKLHYLKSALKGEAANKIKIFTIDGINYSKAWEVLEKAYEVKRVLVSRHISMILNLPSLDRETTEGLTKLADDTQQHLASLKAMNVSIGSEMIVHILENKLPRVTLDKWEASLERDEFPSLDQLYEFLYKTAVCASKRERSKLSESDRALGEFPAKRKRTSFSNRALTLSATRNCTACNVKRHPLYMCDKFKQLPVNKRIEMVKNAKLCYNCLRSHRGVPCKFSSCTVCQKRHNTLLHLDNYATSSKIDESHSEVNKSE